MPRDTDLLKSVFGFDAFRPGQAEIVAAVAAGENTLAIMPTGGGKSLCFQLPALLREGVTVVISPLIALMRDQVRALRAVGVEAGALTSGNTEEETDAVFAALGEGRLKLLYMAPERLASGGTLNLLRRAGVTLIAVDEAHCVSQWGHDFRPDYLRIGDLRRALGVPLAAFTATADAETRDEIVAKLFDGAAPREFLRGFDRPNIHLAFAVKDSPRAQILGFAAARKGQSGIVYTATRAKTETLAQALREEGHPAVAYHGGMEAEARREVERRFQQDDGLIVVATVAFGMGVDKPDIRWVAHADLPKSIEAYYQEIGRAGRDGAPAETLTLYGPDDIRLRRAQIDEGLAPEERRAADHARLNALLGLAETPGCRRQTLLGYFGEDAAPCGNCDCCDSPPDTFDGTVPVMKALSAALRTDEWFGAGHLIDILTGTETDKTRARGHQTLPTWAVGRDLTRREWQAVFRQMMGLDLVRPDPARHGALRVTEKAHPVLRGEEKVILGKPKKGFIEGHGISRLKEEIEQLEFSVGRGAYGQRERDHRDLSEKDERRLKAMKDELRRLQGQQLRTLVSDDDMPLFSALKAKRRALAEAQRVPAYVVFTDRTLIEMAETRPRTLDEMAGISGVGLKKLESYGAAFLEVIAGEVEPMHPARRKLAGRSDGELFDRLQQVQRDLQYGPDGTSKPLACSSSQLSRLVARKPRTASDIRRLLGDRLADRFADAFLEEINSNGDADG